MNATQAPQPAETAGAPPVPLTLRAIAAWLESHPEAAVYHADFHSVHPGEWVVLYGYLAGDDPSLDDQAYRIGEPWREELRRDKRELLWQIAPGVVYRLRDAR